MSRYEVLLTGSMMVSATVTVEASSESDAAAIALRATDLDWQPSCDVEEIAIDEASLCEDALDQEAAS